MASKSTPMARSALQRQGDIIAIAWYQAVASTSLTTMSPAEVQQRLADLAKQAILLLFAQTFDEAKAQSLGVALVRLGFSQADALNRTLDVLATRLVADLQAEQAVAMQPRLAAVLGGVAAGFLHQVREKVLDEQEQIRSALIASVKSAEASLLESFEQLELRVKERTAELAAANEELQVEIAERKRVEAEHRQLLALEHEQRLLAETLREVTLALTSQTSHPAIMDEILRQALHLVPCSAAHFFVLDGDVLRIGRWQGDDVGQAEELLGELVLPLVDFPLNARAITEREPLIVNDALHSPEWVTVEKIGWIRSCLMVPVSLRDRVLGQLNLVSKEAGRFSPEDARRLQPLASAAAVAIENAQLVLGLEAEVERRLAQIQAEQEKSAVILQSVSNAILVADGQAQIIYINPAYTQLTGYTAEEAQGRLAGDIGAGVGQEQVTDSIAVALAEGKGWSGEIKGVRKDGRMYDAAFTVSPMRDGQGNMIGFVSSHEDISQRKALERARSEFISNISHQLRTPVTNIKLYAQMLRRGAPADKMQRYLGVMEEQTDRLSHLVQDFLEMTTLDAGQVIRTWELLDLSRLVRETVGRFECQSETDRLQLVALPLPDDLPAVKGDPLRVAQALGEVVENAVTFTNLWAEKHGSEARVEVGAGTVEEDGRLWVTLTVRDTGPGIPPEEQAQLFDRFFRGQVAAAGTVPGTGLGLSMVWEILQAHGGRVTAESTGVPGQGSVITLWLRAQEQSV